MAKDTNSPQKIGENAFSGIPTFHCNLCGKEFKSRRRNRKYCSIGCKDKHRYKRKSEGLKTIYCKYCGKEFKPKRAWHEFCSEKCRNDLNNFFNYLLDYYGL